METKSWITIDKSEWGEGPWQDEPDKMQWTDEETGLACLVKRNALGALCGYVGIPEGHPWYRMDYGDIPAHAHGGLTYAGHCQEGDDEAQTICHIPGPGEPDNVWWAGFDCSHAYDLCPKTEALLRETRFRRDGGTEDIYRHLAYVQGQRQQLAAQIEVAQA